MRRCFSYVRVNADGDVTRVGSGLTPDGLTITEKLGLRLLRFGFILTVWFAVLEEPTAAGD